MALGTTSSTVGSTRDVGAATTTVFALAVVHKLHILSDCVAEHSARMLFCCCRVTLEPTAISGSSVTLGSIHSVEASFHWHCAALAPGKLSDSDVQEKRPVLPPLLVGPEKPKLI
jgi:hypothetical protein